MKKAAIVKRGFWFQLYSNKLITKIIDQTRNIDPNEKSFAFL